MPRKRKKPLPPLKLGGSTIGERISALRKERGYTQKELADKIGIGHTLVSDYETGRLMLNGEMVARLAIALGASADSILGLKTNGHGKIQTSVRLLRRLNKIAALPVPQKKALLRTIDALLKVQEG